MVGLVGLMNEERGLWAHSAHPNKQTNHSFPLITKEKENNSRKNKKAKAAARFFFNEDKLKAKKKDNSMSEERMELDCLLRQRAGPQP